VTHPIHTRRRGVVHVTRAESVYPTLDAGSVSLIISDGPYGMGKAAWDRQRGPDGLREWYAPHVEAWGRVCADAASVYLWGTQRGVRALQPLMEEHGWTWRVQVTWDKVTTPAMLRPGLWHDVTEACDVYTRGDVSDESPRDGSWNNNRGSAVHYGNVWRLQAMGPHSPLSRERVRTGRRVVAKTADRVSVDEPVHPCQKPLTFYDRIIRASSRPGDLVLEPFGGTLRAAVACEALPDADARRYVCIEPDEDGRGYVPAALEDLDSRMASPGLFGGMG